MLEYLLKWNAKHFRDKEGDFERRRIFSQLDRVDGLACDADAISKLLLGHFVVLLTQFPYAVGEPATHIRARA